MILTLSSDLCLSRHNQIFHSGVPIKILYALIAALMRATYSAHLNHFSFSFRWYSTMGESYGSSSLCYFLHRPTETGRHTVA
jgi:hypothetical protein